MLPSGVQMLPSLWLLLWMPKLGLSTPLSLWDLLANPAITEIPTQYIRACEKVIKEATEKDPKTNASFYEDDVTYEQMVDINDEIYNQFGYSQHTVHMIFNKMDLWRSVSDPSLLCLAELHLHRPRKPQQQLMMLFERDRNNSWPYISYRFLPQDYPANWVWFDVTEVVRRWVNQTGPIEVFRLRVVNVGAEKQNAFHMDIRGLTPSGLSDNPDDERRYRPFLLILLAKLKKVYP